MDIIIFQWIFFVVGLTFMSGFCYFAFKQIGLRIGFYVCKGLLNLLGLSFSIKTFDKVKESENIIDKSFIYSIGGLVVFSLALIINFNVVQPSIKLYYDLNGVQDNYKTGEIYAYYSDVWEHKGALYTTYESRIYESVEDDEHARITFMSAQFRISTHDESIHKKLQAHRGKRVRIKYKGWYHKPMWAGESRNIITDIIPIEEK